MDGLRLMGYELFVSLRYLRAKRKQTFISVISFISIAGVTLGVAALIVVLAVMTGFHDGVRKQILGNIPHVLIQHYGGGMAEPQSVIDVASATPNVLSAQPFVSREAMLLAQGNVSAVSVKGVAEGNKVFNQEFLTLGGRPVQEYFFEPKEGLPGIAIAMDTATTLGVAVGDRINVIPPEFNVTPFGVIPKMKPFEVVGITTAGSGIVDAFYAYISLEQAQLFLGTEGMVTGVEVEVDHFDHVAEVTELLREKLPFPLSVRSWEDLFGSFLSALKLEKLGLFIVLTIIILVAAFNIATTLIMVVMEKSKDIAVLRSMGATSRSITRIFMLEGLIIGSMGTLLGTALGVGIATHADAIIKALEGIFKIKIFEKSVYGMDSFPSVVHGSDVLAVALVAMGISLFATLYPAWRASRMDPAEALRYG